MSVLLHPHDRIGLVACSNALSAQQCQELRRLQEFFRDFSITPVFGKSLLSTSPDDHRPSQRAADLMRLYADPSIKAIFDISGGDLANGILPYLDYDIIGQNPKPFFGYSDLTTVINALYQKSSQVSMLYQIRNLVGPESLSQQHSFCNSMRNGEDDLWTVEWDFLQGNAMHGVLLGGNLRCFLKLAGTPYFPRLDDCLLFLESLGGGPELITSLLCQLKQLGVFDRIRGLLLGTFTRLEEQIGIPATADLLCSVIDRPDLPIAKTQQVGHGANSRCLRIGASYACCASTKDNPLPRLSNG